MDRLAVKVNLTKKIWCCIIVIELLLLAGGAFVYSRRETVTLNYVQDDMCYDNGESGAYLDPSYDYQYIMSPSFTLPKGLYTFTVQYECEDPEFMRLEMLYEDSLLELDVAGYISIPDSGSVSGDFRVKYADRPIIIKGRLRGDARGEDYLLMKEITIGPAESAMRNFFFRIAVLFLIIDLLLLWYTAKERIFANNEAEIYFKALFLLVLFVSIPLMVNYLFDNGVQDLTFHLTRIEGIKDGLLNGDFPVKIQPFWLNDHGYAASVFYGDVFLYIPALLRIMGVSVQGAYKFFIIFINAMTVFLSYHCFSKMSNRKIGLLCAVVYSSHIYRLSDIYTRAAVGEYTAITFLPVVLYGLWKVYMLPEESEEHKRSWITITLGCTGIFLSHMISTEMTALFVLLTGIILWKKTFRKKTLLVLVKAAVATICLNVWFLIPFLDYMVSGLYRVNTSGTAMVDYSLERRGSFVAQFFMTVYSALSGSTKNETGVAGATPLTIGCAGIAVIAGWFLLCMGGSKHESDRAEKKEGNFAFFLCILSLFMATYLFPYTWFAKLFPILEMSEGSLQFPWRFLVIAGVLACYLLCVMMQRGQIDQQKKKLFAGVVLFLALWQSLSYMSGCLNEGAVYRIYQAGGLSSFDVGSGEYIPVVSNEKSDLGQYTEQVTFDADAVSVEDWHREKGAVIVTATNFSEEISQVEVPLLLYKGYQAIADDGQQLQLLPGASYRISVSVPAGFSGSFSVKFREPWYWRLCEWISLFTFIGIIVWTFRPTREKLISVRTKYSFEKRSRNSKESVDKL